MDLGLQGRVYVLTGASRGLGFATAQCLVADGARVVVSSRDVAKVAAAVESLNESAARSGDGSGDGTDGERATGLAADLADPATPERLIGVALARFGRLDGALLSVGGPPRGTAAEATDDQWRSAFETVFLGQVRAARTMLARLGEGGSVGLVLSSSARSPVPGLGISNGLRPGLAVVVKDMADEYGPRGVRVFGLLPYRLLTDRNRELFATAPDPDAARAEAEAAIPLGRLGSAEEFGRVAAFVLSPAASYLTGLSVPVAGGALRVV
jgi:3-oxoacyl-[acyl-carrier protein] reductase